jgi:hypothetical protein
MAKADDKSSTSDKVSTSSSAVDEERLAALGPVVKTARHAVAQWVAPFEPQITSRKTEWRDLLDRERKQRERMFETLPTRGEQHRVAGKQHRVAVRKWWGTVSEVLKGIQNVTDWHDLPYELLDMLAGLAACLAVGQIPLTIKDVGGKGRTAPVPGEISDIRWAVTYVCAVRDGRVQGRKPPLVVRGRRKSSPDAVALAVVCRLYDLRDEQTVRTWCRKYKPFPYPEAWTVSSLRNRVVDAARQYRLNVRTQNARTRAGRKRRQKTVSK